jgi:hypothetical protein
MNLSYHESRARSGSVICNTKLKFWFFKSRRSTYCPGDHYPVSCLVKYGKSNKNKPRVNKHTVIRYRNFKNFDEELFLRDLKFFIEGRVEGVGGWFCNPQLINQGRIQGGRALPLKLEKIWFVCVKWWFFTRNTPKKFKVRPPNLKSWIRPC